jgi:hypothetical protein
MVNCQIGIKGIQNCKDRIIIEFHEAEGGKNGDPQTDEWYHHYSNSIRCVVLLLCSFRRKDYNRLAYRLRAYHSLALFLRAPPLSDVQELEKVHSNLRDL